MSEESSASNTQRLGLMSAAKRIGVHPNTLRRWADQGEIQVLVTPGGHRRFALADLDRFADEHQRLKQMAGLEQIWADRVIIQTRQGLAYHHNARWVQVFDETKREQNRLLGQRLINLLLQYIGHEDNGEDLLVEARAIGREHATTAMQLSLPLTDALQAMLFFRDTMTEVALQLPEVAQGQAAATLRLLRRLNTLLNAVHLAVVDGYVHLIGSLCIWFALGFPITLLLLNYASA